jgi:hypothetical protein
MKEWLNRNIVLCSFLLWLIGSFLFVSFLSVFFKSIDGDAIVAMLMFLFFGIPPLFGAIRGFLHIFRKEFLFFSAMIKIRVIILTLSLMVLSLGMVLFVIVSIAELSIQFTCSGAGCAQGGIGVVMFLPVAYCSYGLVWLANHYFIKYKLWPIPIEPYFSYKVGHFK